MYAQDQLLPWVEALRDDVEDLVLEDAHVHVGLHDPAGLQATADEALRALDEVDSGALVFALSEPDGYREANERMIALADEHPRLHALARLDPADEPLKTAEQALQDGAVGLKLHPRGEGFAMDDSRLDDTFALADDRRLPIMIHAGVGSPSVGPQTIQRALEHPHARFILAHCGVGVFERVLPHVEEVPNLFFDTSWWNPGDVWGLLRLVPPGRILYGSDIPFASPAEGIVLTGRLAVQAGLNGDQLRSVMGGQLARLIAHEEPLDVGPVPEDVATLPAELEPLSARLCPPVEPMLRGEDPGQGFELARVCTQAPEGEHTEVIKAVGALLALVDEATPDPLRPLRTPGFDLVLAAAVVARTPDASLPHPRLIDSILAGGGSA